MKIAKRAIWTIIIGIVILIIVPITVLHIPYFQQKIAHAAISYLEDQIGTKVALQSVYFQPFNHLVLNGVYIEDQAGDTLFYAKKVSAGFDFLPLFYQQFHFISITLNTFTAHLSKETPETPLNIQYIIDAFKSKKKTTPAKIDLNIKDLALNHGNFSYRVKSAEKTSTKFNPNHILINDLTTKIHLKKLKNNQLDAILQQMRFKEQSGLEIKNLTFDLSCYSDSVKICRLELQLPHSQLLLTNIFANSNPLDTNNDWTKTYFNLQIEPSKVLLRDIRSLVPALAHFKEILEIQGRVSGTLNELQLTGFQAQDGNNLRLAMNVTVSDFNSHTPNSIYVDGNIKNAHLSPAGLQKMSDNFHAASVPLPAIVQRLGTVALNGEIDGTINDLTAFVSVNTGIGNLHAEVNMGTNHSHFLKGQISSTELNLQQLLDNNDFGIAQFSVDLNTTFHNQQDIKGTVDAMINPLDYKAYRYENIHLAGDFTANSFNGKLQIDSPDGKLTADGFALLNGKDSQFKFAAQASDLQLDKLHWETKHDQPKLSFYVDADVQGNDIDRMLGHLELLNLRFSSKQENYKLNQFLIRSTQTGDQKQLRVLSNIVNGTIAGDFSLKQLPNALKQSLRHYLPSLLPADEKTKPAENMNFQWNFDIHNTQQLSNILHLPVIFSDNTQISGTYNNAANHFQLHADFPQLSFGKDIITNGKIDANNTDDALTLNINGTKLQKNDNNLILTAKFKAEKDAVHSSLRWNNILSSRYKGELDFITQLTAAPGHPFPDTHIKIQPSEMIFNDSIWTLSSTNLQYIAGQFCVDHLQARHHHQMITIEGATSKNAEDKLWISLQQVNLDYIFKSLKIKALEFGGIATGKVAAQDLFDTHQLSTDLNVSRFSFNNTLFGDLDLHGRWDEQAQGIEMHGRVVKNDSSSVDIDGFIYPVKEELSINFDAHKADAAFLRKYLNNIMTNLSGELTGKIRLFGDLNDPTVEGKAFAQNTRFGVEFLNTHYNFTDSVYLKADKIYIKNLMLTDDFGNKAIANGSVHHQLFENFKFEATLNYNHFQVFNATPRTSPNCYGTAFGTGTAIIKGTEELVMIDVSLENNENTALTLNFMQQPDVVEYNFINFVERNPQQALKTQPILPAKTSFGTEIRLNVLVNANNSASLDMIMDPVTGDKITSTGSGILQVQYSTKLPLKVFGNYQIEKGKYNFSFQQAFVRNFEIEEGSSVNFHGDPLTADLNIKAAYTVSANLGDLDQQLVQSDAYRLSTRTSIPVNCVLLLSGALEQPQIKFDVELPGATAELSRQVKSYIRTDDMMNRQIVYLLLMGRFYTAPEYVRNDTRQGNDLSYLTSTLSSQLTNFLGSLSNKVQVGTNFHQSYEGEDASTEIEVLLSSNLFNNRLIINGNFGYVDKAYFQSANNSPLIGDFDVEYKLTPSGNIRLKGFNHYNYRNYFSLTPEMTQGFGIIFRRDFNNWKDFVRPIK